MQVIVFVKAILDPEAPPGAIRFEGGVQPGDVQQVLGPFEGNALELAVQLGEAGGSFSAVAVGPQSQDVALRKALALGAAAAVRVEQPAGFQDPLAAAARLAAAAQGLGGADVYLFGRQAGDWDLGVTAGLFAGRLGLPFVPLVQAVRPEGGGLRIRREIAGGYEESVRALPLVLSATNGPQTLLRLPKVKDVMLANRKPIDVQAPAAVDERLTLRGIEAAQLQRAGRRLEGDVTAKALALAEELRRFMPKGGDA